MRLEENKNAKTAVKEKPKAFWVADNSNLRILSLT